MDANARLERLQTATRQFEQRRYAEVRETLAALDGSGDSLELGLELASRGLLLEAEGRVREATPLMEEALAANAPLAPLLAELARFFGRVGRPLLAHYAFLLEDTLKPRSMMPFVDEQPDHERARYAPWYLRHSHVARRGDLYGLARYKAALAERYGAEGAGVILAGMVQQPRGWVAKRRPLVPLETFAASRGEAFRTLIEPHPITNRAARTLGADPPAPVERRARRVHTSALEDVVVSSRSNFLLADDVAILDVTGQELASRRMDLGVDPIIVTGDGASVVCIEPRDPGGIRRIDVAITLVGTHSRAFGHWVIEFLPRLWALMDVEGFDAIPILVDAGMPPQHLESLRLLLGREHPVIELRNEERILVERMWVSAAMVFFAIGPISSDANQPLSGTDEAGFGRLFGRMRAVLERIDSRGTPERLYIGRKPSQHRRLHNVEAVEAALAERGFERVDFGDLTFAEQLRLIRGAREVVVAGGSAALMGIFAPPGLRMAILLPARSRDAGWLEQVGAVTGLDLTVIHGKTVREHERYHWMSDYEIDLAVLTGYLDETAVPAGETVSREG